MQNTVTGCDLMCPNCNGNWSEFDLECSVCLRGIIPNRTMEFIRKNMTEYKDHFLCQYNDVVMAPVAVIEINFKIQKPNLRVYAFRYVGPIQLDLPANTVELIDKMRSHFNKGIYLPT